MQLGVCSVYFTFLASVLDHVVPLRGGIFTTVRQSAVCLSARVARRRWQRLSVSTGAVW